MGACGGAGAERLLAISAPVGGLRSPDIASAGAAAAGAAGFPGKPGAPGSPSGPCNPSDFCIAGAAGAAAAGRASPDSTAPHAASAVISARSPASTKTNLLLFIIHPSTNFRSNITILATSRCPHERLSIHLTTQPPTLFHIPQPHPRYPKFPLDNPYIRAYHRSHTQRTYIRYKPSLFPERVRMRAKVPSPVKGEG